MRKQPPYLDDYYSVLETVQDLDLNSYSQVIKAQNAHYWLEAMREEIESIEKNHVWQLIDLPKDWKVVECKWVLRKKLKSNGSFGEYKTRLVAKGFTQVEGINYETFSPVVKFQSI